MAGDAESQNYDFGAGGIGASWMPPEGYTAPNPFDMDAAAKTLSPYYAQYGLTPEQVRAGMSVTGLQGGLESSTGGGEGGTQNTYGPGGYSVSVNGPGYGVGGAQGRIGNTYHVFGNDGTYGYSGENPESSGALDFGIFLASVLSMGLAGPAMGAAGEAATLAADGSMSAAGYAGLDAASAATLGGGASLEGLSGITAAAGGATGAASAWSPEMAQAMSSMGDTGATSAATGSTLYDAATNPLSKAMLDGTNAFGANSIPNGAYDLGSAAGSGFGSDLAKTIAKATGSSLLNGGGSGTGSTGNGGGMGDLAKLLIGLYGANQQRGASSDTLDYLKGRQSINDNMYAPGSPEYNALWDQMSRKDAAAGRNSQYGPRSVDLGAKIAGLKMSNNTQMTTGIARALAQANTDKGNASSNFTNLLGSLFGGGSSGLSLDSLIKNLMSQNYNGVNTDFYNGNLTPDAYRSASNAANLDTDPDFNGSAFDYLP